MARVSLRFDTRDVLVTNVILYIRVDNDHDIKLDVLREFVTAVKVSCIRQLRFPFFPVVSEPADCDETFCTCLGSVWFDMLITLLSVRLIPRLGMHSPFRTLPLDLIRNAAQTLGWTFPDYTSSIDYADDSQNDDDDEESDS